MIFYFTVALVALVASYRLTHDWLTAFVLGFAILSTSYVHLYRGVLNKPAIEEEH